MFTLDLIISVRIGYCWKRSVNRSPLFVFVLSIGLQIPPIPGRLHGA